MGLAEKSLFRPNPRDLICEAFLNNQKRFVAHDSMDCIDDFFHRLFVEFICKFFPAVEQTKEKWRARVVESLEAGFPLLNEHSLARWVSVFATADPPEKLKEELAVFLEIMRERYFSFIRGPKEFCWQRIAPVIERESPVCPSRDECWSGSLEATEALDQRKCAKYTMSWSGTELAIRTWESACDSSNTLVRLLYLKSPLLKLATDPEGLADFLKQQYFPGNRGNARHRTSRGAVVRMLTMLCNHCLEDLNSQLALTGESQLGFPQPPAGGGSSQG